MPINFPSNPSTNDVYTYGGRSWKYNGTGWETTNPSAANAGGDLTGTYPNPTIATGAVTSAKIADEPGCPWIGWTRDENGDFISPPEPVFIRYAVVKKLDGLVVDFKMIEEGASSELEEPASFEYRLVECADENVEPGWTYSEGEFVQ